MLRLQREAADAQDLHAPLAVLVHRQARFCGQHSCLGDVQALGNLAPPLQQGLQLALLLSHQLPPLPVQGHAHEHPAAIPLDHGGGLVAFPKPLPLKRAPPDPLHQQRLTNQLRGAAVPTVRPEAVLDPRGRGVAAQGPERRVQAAPVALDTYGGHDRVARLAPVGKVPVALLDGDGASVEEHPEEQRPQHDVEEDDREREGAVVVFGAVGHVEELVYDRDVPALPHSLAPGRRRLVGAGDDGAQERALLPHEVSHLLDNAQRRVPVEEVEQALAIAVVGPRSPPLRPQLRDPGARLRRERGHGAVGLGPVVGQPVVHLAAEDLHELGPGAHVQALELEVVVRVEARRVERLAHRDQDLGREVGVALVRRQAVEDQAGQALVRDADELVVPVPRPPGQVLPHAAQAVAGVRRHLLAHGDLLLREDAPAPALLHGLVAGRIAGPTHRGGEELRGHVREDVPRDGEQHVRGQVRVLAGLVVREPRGLGHAQAPAPELLVGELASHRNEAYRALERALDLLQHVLDLPRQVPPPGVDVVPERARGRGEGDEHGAVALVRLALLAAQVGRELGVEVPAPVPLNQQCRRVFQLVVQDILALQPQRLEPCVNHQLYIQLRLEAPPVPLQRQARGLHALQPPAGR
mmetsp:Transcript_110875/g.313625  ORF Transcript_110875/g.313625 Transcript_110875/m.313625 type:complete len:638 (-) Transcript_110875:1672-3585(-)